MKKNAVAVAVLLAAVLGGVLLWSAVGGDEARRPAALQSYSSGKLALFLYDGKVTTPLAFVKKVDCGTVSAAVVSDPSTEKSVGSDPKHIGPAAPEECAIEVGFTMDKGFWVWVNGTLDGNVLPKTVWLVRYDLNNNPQGRLELAGTRLKALSLSSFDASSNAAADLEATLVPQQIKRIEPATGPALPAAGVLATKSVLQSGFKFEVAGQAVPGAVKIDAWRAEAEPVEGAPADTPGRARLGNIGVEVSEGQVASIAILDNFLEKFLINGGSGPESETTAKLSMLAGTGATVAELSFGGVGIFRGDLLGRETGSVARRRYSLYAKTADFAVF